MLRRRDILRLASFIQLPRHLLRYDNMSIRCIYSDDIDGYATAMSACCIVYWLIRMSVNNGAL